MSIFVFIGAAAIGILRTGLSTWHTGESRRETLETAQFVLAQIGQDLRSIYTHEFLEGQSANIMLVCDRDAQGRQRMRFVRTVEGAVSSFTHREAGALLGAEKDLDLNQDYTEARMGDLRPTGGLCELAYVMDSDPASTKLFRGLRAPIGGAGTFFVDSNLTPGGASSSLIEFAEGVLYLGFHFRTQYTNTWDLRHLPIIMPAADEKSGPALWWDSTRSRTPPFKPEDREFTTFLSGSSLLDPSDDIFPRAVQVVLVVAEGETGAISKLSSDIDEESTRIPVEDYRVFAASEYKYVKIGGEWIRYAEAKRGALVLRDEYGRGARWSIPAAHRRGALVQAGRTFSLILRLPGGREDWNSR